MQWIALVIYFYRILTTTAQGCLGRADIIFLLDGSDSISDGEFTEQKKFVEHFITQSDIGQDRVRVGVIVVSSDIGDTVHFKQSTNRNRLIKAVNMLQQPQDGSRIDLGINQLERMLYSEGQANVTQIGIIVTDGRSKYPDASTGESEAVKSVGIHLLCIGVGRLVDEKRLRTMAFSPNEYFYIEPFEQSLDRLLKVTTSLSKSQCTEIQRKTTIKASTPPPTTSSTTVPTTTTTRKTTTTTAATTQRPVYVVEQSPLDAVLNQQMIISVKSNILNGEDIVGTKVEKMFAGEDDQWWNAHQNELQVEPGYRETPYQEQKWYNPVDPIHAPWVTIPPDKSTPMAWRTYAPTTSNYQTYANVPGENGHMDPNHWSGEYRNPLLPVKLFSIDMPIKIYHDTNRHQFIPRQSTTRKQVFPTSTTTALTTTKVTTRTPEVHKQLPVGRVSNPDKIEEEQLCYGSQYVDGVGYNADPKSCSEFIQCFYEGGQIKVEKARCPFRMFWDQRLLLCRPATSISCWRDPCFDFTVRSYDYKGNCRAHWSCRNGLSQAKCCRVGFAYSDDKQECIPEPGCNDWCEDTGELTFTSPFASCRMTPFETNERFYFEEIPGLGMMTRSCPRGSQYNPGLCTCDRSDEVRKKTCRPELILDFQDGFNDKSGNNLAVTPENVHIESGAARFDGRGKIRLWRFAGVSYGSQFAVTMKYKENPHTQATEPMHLLSNCFNPEVMRPSIDIAISPSKGAMFLATTDKGGEQMAILKYNSTEWKTLSFVYDGKQLTGSVNGVKTSVPLRGVIEERPSALILGACDYFGGYGGLMDDVKLYLCIPHGII